MKMNEIFRALYNEHFTIRKFRLFANDIHNIRQKEVS